MATMHSYDVVHGRYAHGIQLSVRTGIQYWFFEVLGLLHGVLRKRLEQLIRSAIISVSVIQTEILRLQCKSSANYTINVNDAALQGSLIMRLYFRTDEECRFACLMDVRCKSYNKEIAGDKRCELNDKNTEIKEDQVTLMRRPGWIFKSTNYSDPLLGENCINVNPCPENVMCRDTCSCPGYKCYPCPKGKFGLRCDKDCDKLMTSASGSFQSPNYPSPYPNNATCIYRISLPGGTKINLIIEKIYLESSQNCTNDKLRIYDGMNTSATKLARICNSSDNRREFKSSGNHLFLVFKSDSKVTKTGFKASYTTIPPACSMLMTTESETFQSPNYPSSYPHITTCEFNISLPVGNRIKLDIKYIDLQQCNGCKCDSLSIYNGSSSNAIKMATICNSHNVGRPFISSGNNLFVVFKSDGNVTKSGFQASYTAIPPGVDPPGDRIKLFIDDINLEPAKDCKYDELGIYDGSSTTNAVKLATICTSNNTGRHFVSSGNHLLVVFKSDRNRAFKGFKASYTTATPEDYLIGKTWKFESLHYPNRFLFIEPATTA